MAYNKFITSSGRIFLDLTNDTITPEDLREGVIAHDRSGNTIVGAMEEYDGTVVIE